MTPQRSSALRRRLRPLFLGFAVWLAGAGVAGATLMKYFEVEELARLATDVFRGQVVATETYWDAGRTRIYTAVRVRVDETLKGAAAPGETVTVTQLGGEKDGVLLDFVGRPRFAAGESVVLFTRRGRGADYLVVGLRQGKMRLAGDQVERDFSGLTLIADGGLGRPPRPLQVARQSLTLGELRRRVVRAR
jgi:hypothetical protein